MERSVMRGRVLGRSSRISPRCARLHPGSMLLAEERAQRASVSEGGERVRILGISAFYHDSAACLLDDGRIVAAVQEERFTRKKRSEERRVGKECRSRWS